MYEYKGRVDRIDHQNILKITLDMGFGITNTVKFSLNDIMCCRDCIICDRSKCPIEHVNGRLKQLVLNKDVIIKTYKAGGCDVNIYAADVYVESNQGLLCVNDQLVIEKLAEYIN